MPVISQCPKCGESDIFRNEAEFVNAPYCDTCNSKMVIVKNRRATMKMRVGPFGTECRKLEGHSSTWEFVTQNYRWQSQYVGPNVELSVSNIESREFVPVLEIDTLDHAVAFAHGYELGTAKNRHPCCVGPNYTEALETLKKAIRT